MNHIVLKGFIETSFVDWPGRIASVVFLPGCSFNCGWCHNRTLIETPDRLPDIPLDDIIERIHQLADWVDGLVITGGEPTIFGALSDVVRVGRTVVPVKLDTNGSRPDVIERLLNDGVLDGVSMDIKAPLDPVPYSRAAGVAVDVSNIQRSIRLILDAKIWCEFRTTVVPGLHAPNDIALIRRQLQELAGSPLPRPLKLQAFKPIDDLPEPWRSMKEPDLEPYLAT
ncbi:anaerobic ribonucleoside-triphosphate reductase activating protein [bacterium]|nr:anaerobic ribonucleoside-triphosphate reductase activating protein [candidate division CSSED10-310 bacterium]